MMEIPFFGSLAPSEGLAGLVVLALVTAIAAAINSVAGGGTILTFPVLAAILPDGPARMVMANATSTIGLWPGAVSAAWAYRGERAGQPPWARWLLVPSVAGAVVGSLLVLVLPPRWFAALVPWLILVAAILFAVQPQLTRLATMRRRRPGRLREAPARWRSPASCSFWSRSTAATSVPASASSCSPCSADSALATSTGSTP